MKTEIIREMAGFVNALSRIMRLDFSNRFGLAYLTFYQICLFELKFAKNRSILQK
ncbi:MAG: hypothetical protein WCK42_09890 [Myxococcaceae bacterium]